MALSIPDEHYSRNLLYTLNKISIYFLSTKNLVANEIKSTQIIVNLTNYILDYISDHFDVITNMMTK